MESSSSSTAAGGLGFYSTTSSSVVESVNVAREWRNAQAIPLSVAPDIVTAAKLQLQFLAEISQVAQASLLQAGPTLERAILRYEQCWLPLLASRSGNDDLVPPLDCSWVWHCHRLNPNQYADDCIRLYGKLLGVHGVRTSVKATKELWQERYPDEPYHLELPWSPQASGASALEKSKRGIEYDLVGAVTRQSSFYHQVSQAYVTEDSYLRSAEQRYKAFLYLFKNCSTGTFLVPTYDIDLMWHTHQLDPVAYNRDLLVLAGRLLQHDDDTVDDDREEGGSLRTGFRETKRLWEETFGSLYEKAGAMYQGPAPSPLPLLQIPPLQPEHVSFGSVYLKLREDQRQYLGERESVQLCVSVLGVRNVQPLKSGSKIFVTVKGFRNCGEFQLSTPEVDAMTSPGWNHDDPWMFRCATSVEGLVLELRVHQPRGLLTSLTGSSSSKLVGEVRIPFDTILVSPGLAVQEWYAVGSTPKSRSHGSEYSGEMMKLQGPGLLVAASITPPVSAPYLLRGVNGNVQSDIFDTVKVSERGMHTGRWLTRVILDHFGQEKFLVRVRKMKGRMKKCHPVRESEKEVLVWKRDPMKMKEKPWSRKSVEFASAARQLMDTQAQKDNANAEREWILLEQSTTLKVKKTQDDPNWEDHLEFELTGAIGYPVKLLCGRWLQYQVHGAKPEDESGFVTIIRYTPDCPSGKATALFNWKAAIMEVGVEENIMLVILLSTVIALVVDDLMGPRGAKILKKTKNKDFPGNAQWGAVIMDRRFKPNASVVYQDWWVDPKTWATAIYSNDKGGYRGGSGCGGGGCGGAVCASGCTGDGDGGLYKDMLSFSGDFKWG